MAAPELGGKEARVHHICRQESNSHFKSIPLVQRTMNVKVGKTMIQLRSTLHARYKLHAQAGGP